MLRVRGAALTITTFRKSAPIFSKNASIWAGVFEVMLKFSIFPKLRPSLKLHTQHNCEVFAHCAQRRMWQMQCTLPILAALTGGQGGGGVHGVHGAGSPQLAAGCERRGRGGVKQPCRKVCREAQQRRSHRHLQSASGRGSAHRPGVCA